jgi:uncharacterized membrane protein
MSHGEFYDDQNPYIAPQRGAKEFGVGGPGELALSGRSVSFDAIGRAFNLVQSRFGTWILISFVYFAVYMGINLVVGFAGTLVQGALLSLAQDDLTRGIILFVYLAMSQTVSIVLSSFFTGGFFLAALKHAKGHTFGVEDLFGASGVLVALIVSSLLVSLAILAGSLFCLIPGIYIGVRLALTTPLIVDRGLSATEAMTWSWRAMGGNVLTTFFIGFCLVVILVISVLLCCVPILFTMPVFYMAFVVIYLDLFRAKPKPSSAGDVFYEGA